jgi:hypothetical protein
MGGAATMRLPVAKQVVRAWVLTAGIMALAALVFALPG